MNFSPAGTGLREADLTYLQGLFAAVPALQEAVLYGSRARGHFRPGADVDVAVKGSGLTPKELFHFSSELEDTSIPFFFDIVHYDTISNEAFRAQIDKDGVLIYQRSTAAHIQAV